MPHYDLPRRDQPPRHSFCLLLLTDSEHNFLMEVLEDASDFFAQRGRMPYDEEAIRLRQAQMLVTRYLSTSTGEKWLVQPQRPSRLDQLVDADPTEPATLCATVVTPATAPVVGD